MMKKLETVGLVHLKDNKLLLAFSANKKAWYLPGGKIDPLENSRDALSREIKEELNYALMPDHIAFYTHIQAAAYGEEELLMEQDCFFYLSDFTPVASQEIEAIQYFSFQAYQQLSVQVPGVLILYDQLLADGFLTAKDEL